MTELVLRIKTKTGKTVELNEEEARTVLNELKRILEPRQAPSPYYPVPVPWVEPAKPWWPEPIIAWWDHSSTGSPPFIPFRQ